MHLLTAHPRVVLRAWRTCDRESLVRHGDDVRVWRNLGDIFPRPYTLQAADAWIAHVAAPGASVHLAIDHDGEAIGGIGIVAGEGNSHHTGRFGYWLGAAFWGRGIATHAARALKDQAFAGGRFVRLEAPVFAWNPASMRVLEKCGFVREGVLRRSVLKDGQLIDSVMYAALRDEPPERSGPAAD